MIPCINLIFIKVCPVIDKVPRPLQHLGLYNLYNISAVCAKLRLEHPPEIVEATVRQKDYNIITLYNIFPAKYPIYSILGEIFLEKI